MTVRVNNRANEQTPIEANPIINLDKKIFSDVNCSIPADAHQFEVGNTLCYEIEITNESNSPWYYPKGTIGMLFDQLPSDIPNLSCKFLSGSSWINCSSSP